MKGGEEGIVRIKRQRRVEGEERRHRVEDKLDLFQLEVNSETESRGR